MTDPLPPMIPTTPPIERRSSDFWKKLSAYSSGIIAVVAGIVVTKWKWINMPDLGMGLTAMGMLWLGKIHSQPEFMKPADVVASDRKSPSEP